MNAQSVQGAICVYLLLGLFFVFVYGACTYLGDGPFFAQEDGTRARRVYFSYVALGDARSTATSRRPDRWVVPSPSPRPSLGQLYLVTVVALVVSRFGRPRSASSRQDDGRADGGSTSYA